MFRSQYDTDTITWSPQGRIFQIEYAMEAVSQGTAVVGMRSKTHAVLACIKRAPSELASFQQKIFPVDKNIGVGISGLTGDARVLCDYLRSEALNHRYVYDSPATVSRLVEEMCNMAQEKTQRSGQRAYGVGLMVIGYDNHGAQLFETCPSGNHFEYHCHAIGGRSQSAKTYMEKHFETFDGLPRDELVMHALKAVMKCTAADVEITTKNVAIAVVGLGEDFHEFNEEELRPLIEQVAAETPAPMEGVEE